MRRTLLFLLICAVQSAVAIPVSAQWICHATAGMNFAKGSDWYGTYWYTALACKGDVAVAAANVTTLTQHGPYGFYLAFLISIDGGETWNVSAHGLPEPTWDHRPIVRKIEIIDPLHIVAFGDSGLLVRTTNGGATWQELSAPSSSRIGDICFRDTSHGVMSVWDTAQGTYITSDGGANWSPVPFTRLAVAQCHDYGDGLYRFFSVFAGRVYTIQNNWTSIDSTGPIVQDSTARHFFYTGCSFAGRDTLFVYGSRNYQAVRQGLRPFIARSTNGGRDWDHVYDADTSNFWDLGSAEYMSDVSRDTIVAGLRGGANQIMWSSNRGVSWQFDTLIERDSIDNLASDSYGVELNAQGDLIAANTFDGAEGAFLLFGTRSVESVTVPRTMRNRLQIFPSPADNAVAVSGELDGSTFHIIDMLGREVLTATALNRTAELDITQLPAGVYFVVNGESTVKFVKR